MGQIVGKFINCMKDLINKQALKPTVYKAFSLVNPLVQNSNSFLDDLRRLNQLKESPFQKDINVRELQNTLKNKLKR